MAPNRPFTVNPALTGIAIGYVNPSVALIADQAMPRVEVPGETFKWTEYPLAECFTVPDTKVGRKGKVGEVEFSGTEQSGFVESYGLQDSIPQSDIDSARAQREQKLSTFDPEARATAMLTNLVALDREIRVAAKVQSAASYEAANIIALANAADRFDVDTGDPEAKIDQALNGVLIFRPNTCVMSESVWQKLRKQTKLVQAIKGTTQGDGKVTREEFAKYFELQNVLIGAGYVNTARKGQPVNMQRVWGKHIAFTYLDRSIQRTDEGGVTWGFSPTFGTRVAGDMVDPNIGLKGGRVIRVGEQINELVVCKAAGALIQNAIS
jgi:hypothetical protein